MAAEIYDYKFAPRADFDLEDTLQYMKDKLLNLKAAKDFTTELFDKIDLYREFPESGQRVLNQYVTNKDLRKFFVGNYCVFYLPIKKSKLLVIVRILYSGRNINEILKTDSMKY